VIESLAMGTAVLLSRNVGLANYVEQNDFGWLCEQSAASLAQALYAAWANGNRRQKIRQEAPAIIRNHFNETALTERYIGMYQEIISNG